MSQTRHAAIAIIAYNRLQTGPKTQAGGLNDGFTSVGYQVSTLDIVINAPIPETLKHATKNPVRARIFLNLGCIIERDYTEL